MININGNLDSLFKLPMKIMVALCISSGLILFLPNSLAKKVYMLSFRDDFGFILGLVFIISTSIIICTLIVYILGLINKKRQTKKAKAGREKFMQDLDKNERKLLKEMHKQADKTLELPYNSGMITKLSNFGLISPVAGNNYVDLLDPRLNFFLQPWVCKYIEEHKDF